MELLGKLSGLRRDVGLETGTSLVSSTPGVGSLSSISYRQE